MNWSRTENFKIRGYEIGPDQRVPLQNLCGYMEEAAALHAAELGLSVEKLARRGLAWALARTRMEFGELPRLDCLGGGEAGDAPGDDPGGETCGEVSREMGEWIQVETWPVAVEKLQYRRDFLMTWRGRLKN